MELNWINLKDERPPSDLDEILVCDSGGYVSVESTRGVQNVAMGWQEWDESYEFGNGRKVVAWMPKPPFPKHLCDEDADGSMP